MTLDPDDSSAVDLDALGNTIEGSDAEAGDRARRHLQSVGRADGLGRLVELAQWWAAVRGDARAAPPGRIRHLGIDVALPGSGSTDHDDATDRATDAAIDDAIAWGIRTADDVADSGIELVLLTADDPIGARLVAAELMGLDPVEANGWPQERGMDDDDWMDELVVLRDGLRRTSGRRGDPVALLRAVGSVRIAAASAFMVQATARRTPVLLDGPGAGSAALLARRTAYVANQWWQAAHASDVPLHARTVTSLNLDPLVNLGITVEDGTAAQVALGVLALAAGLLTRDPERVDDDTTGE